MTPWCVVQYDPSAMAEVRYATPATALRERGNHSDGWYYAQWRNHSRSSEGFLDPYSDPLTPHVHVFFVASEAEADRLVEALSRKNQGKEFGKAKLMTVAVAQISKPVYSQFTEKGLLPL